MACYDCPADVKGQRPVTSVESHLFGMRGVWRPAGCEVARVLQGDARRSDDPGASAAAPVDVEAIGLRLKCLVHRLIGVRHEYQRHVDAAVPHPEPATIAPRDGKLTVVPKTIGYVGPVLGKVGTLGRSLGAIQAGVYGINSGRQPLNFSIAKRRLDDGKV